MEQEFQSKAVLVPPLELREINDELVTTRDKVRYAALLQEAYKRGDEHLNRLIRQVEDAGEGWLLHAASELNRATVLIFRRRVPAPTRGVNEEAKKKTED